MSDSISTQINLSRDSIREQLISYMKNNLELENVDLTKSSFLSFLVNVLSSLTSNLLFYQMSVYKEFFLTQAQLPESIFNLSAFLGYNSPNANYSNATAIVTVPFGFPDATNIFTIPTGFKFKTDNEIQFVTYYTVTVTVTSNSSVTVVLTEGTKRYNLAVDVGSSDFSFALPLRQYKTVIQEFKIDDYLEEYQFVTIDVPMTGKVAEMEVKFIDPTDLSETIWTEFDSLYLMNETSEGYVSRRTDSGRRLYFGNNLIGVQPTAGSTLIVTTNETEGANGNIIAGSIRTGERLYTTIDLGTNQLVSYDVTNPSSATGGTDEESLEAIRSNSIAALTSLTRLVTENNYKNIDTVIPNAPLGANSLTVKKTSDIKTNETNLYSSIEFDGDIVPTRSIYYEVPYSTTFIPRGTTITFDSIDYYTIFYMNIDILNSVAEYIYILDELEQIPTLITSYSSQYDLIISNLVVSKVGNKAVFTLHYISTETNYENCTCKMQFASTEITHAMTNDSTASTFTYEFPLYTTIPEDDQLYYFTLTDPSSIDMARYSATLTFAKDCSGFMLSNTNYDGTDTTTIYDIPVIKKSYYDSINQRTFESSVLQPIISSLGLTSYRMLSDFTNFKFVNTTGNCVNMKYNPPTRTSVINLRGSAPTGMDVGDRYILTTGTYQNYIFEATDSTSGTYIEAITDDIVQVTSLNKFYIYSDIGWIEIPEYTIPFEIEIEIFKESSYADSNTTLSDTIKTAIVNNFQSRFGANLALYRSEIIDTVQSIDGIDHCRLLQPTSNIFFSFEISDLSEDELLEYTPDYVYFDSSNITVRII